MEIIYKIDQIDKCMLNYANAYIKQVVNNSQKNYFRSKLRHTKFNFSFEEYNDNINYFENENQEIDVTLQFVEFDMFRISIESDKLYEAINKLTDKQLEVIIKNIILDIPMQDVAAQMKISLGKAYKHKRNAINILRRRLKDVNFKI